MKKSIQNTEHYQWGENCDGWHLLKSGSLSVIQEKMPPGTSELVHCHRQAQQLFYILSGAAAFYVDGVTHVLSKNESIQIPAGVLHNIRNHDSEDLEFLVISEPPVQGDRIEIVDYREDLKTVIKDLNIEWLEKYFRVEKNDEIQLSDPQREIIDKGGFIYYARYKGEIVGTASLLKITEDCFELGKMAVTEHAKDSGIGNVLMAYCLQAAHAKGISKLVLYSNTSLAPAIHLYKKYGFYEIPLEHAYYERANIKMEKIIHTTTR
jgi:mannose-6-phosphate isomerase-like protein (cupin superfamily)/N-acetylglutamate synthase-like GNAT family acetyltransferase